MAMGRPKKIIEQRKFEALCGIMCTQEEICDILDVSDKTLNNWCVDTYGVTFSEVYKKKTANGKASLRRTQFQLAEKNPTMAIWLGKQWLNQKDSPQSEENTAKVIDALLQAVKNVE